MSARPSTATLLGAAALFCAWAPAAGAQASGPRARAARTIALNETGRLYLTSKRGFTLNEEGAASGTIRGRIYTHLKIYPSGGSLTGNATAAYRVIGTTASFCRTMAIARGSGGYRNASGSGLGFAGTIARQTDAVTVHPTGRLSV